METLPSSEDKPPSSDAHSFRLSVVFGPAEGVSKILINGPLVVGRGDMALALEDPEVSKRHFALSWDTSRASWMIMDLGSRNGTWLNGERTEKASLTCGDVLRIGKSLLIFDSVGRTAALEPEWSSLPGPSWAMQRLRAEIALVAPQKVPVLVLGESGTGKELVAEAVHERSGVKGPFVPVNCGAINASLAESELFGHVQGAFSGASKASTGLLRAAEGGTLFLDEIGEFPLELQPKLLRALSKGEVRPVGSAQTKTVNFRVVAATHRDLQSAVTAGTFRQDLWARLAGWTLAVPPLRARKEDVLALAGRFAATARGGQGLTLAAAEALLRYPWPLNVRELEQIVQAAVVRARGKAIDVGDLQLPKDSVLKIEAVDQQVPAGLRRLRRDEGPTRDELALAIAQCEGNFSRVAERYGKDRKQIYRWAEKHGLLSRNS